MKKIDNFEIALFSRDFNRLNKCENLKSLKLGEIIGEGVEGQIFESNGFVIKIGMIEKINSMEEKVAIESLCALLLSEQVKKGNTINFPLINDVFLCDKTNEENYTAVYTLMERLIMFMDTNDNLGINFTADLMENIILQLLASIYFMQEKFKMSHQDLHTGNIMLRKIKDGQGKFLNYKVNGKRLKIPNMGWALVIIDFGFTTFNYKGVHYSANFNRINKVFNIREEFRPAYDLLYSLIIIFDRTEERLIKDVITDIILDITDEALFTEYSRPLNPLPDMNARKALRIVEKKYGENPDPKNVKFSDNWPFAGKGWFSFSNR